MIVNGNILAYGNAPHPSECSQVPAPVLAAVSTGDFPGMNTTASERFIGERYPWNAFVRTVRRKHRDKQVSVEITPQLGRQYGVPSGTLFIGGDGYRLDSNEGGDYEPSDPVY